MSIQAHTDIPQVARPKRAPPPRRAQLLAFIREEIAAGGNFPTTKAMCAFMGWKNEPSAADALYGLAMDGHVRRVRRARAFKWELVP